MSPTTGSATTCEPRLHLVAGDVIESISSDVGVDADVLALHLAEGGDHERAYRYATLAAERAERTHGTTDARVHLERALAAARRLPSLPPVEIRQLWIRLGDVRDAAGLLEMALDAYRHAARLDADAVGQSDLLLRRARVRERAGAFPAALREATIARRRLAGRSDLRRRVQPGPEPPPSPLSSGSDRSAPPRRCVSARSAAEEAAACGDRSALARASGVIAWAGLVLGRHDSVEHTQRALELFEEVGDLVGQAHMANNLGGYTYLPGRLDGDTRVVRPLRGCLSTHGERHRRGARHGQHRARCSSTRAGSTRPSPSCATPPGCSGCRGTSGAPPSPRCTSAGS